MAQQYYSQNRGDQGASQRNERPDYNLNTQKTDIQKWITHGIDKDTVVFADKFGKYIADNGLTTSQIRAAFGEMRRIQMNGYESLKTDFILLKPKLAYAVKRHKKEGLTKYFDFFSIGYEVVDSETHFNNFMQLMEAVLAYHKFHGGKESH